VKLKELQFQIGGTVKLVTEESPAGAYITTHFEGLTITAKGDHMAYKLPDDKKIKVQVSYVDAKGNPAKVEDGSIVWSSSDDSIVTVTQDAIDPATAWVAAVGPLGQAQASVTADADLGDGVRELVTMLDVEIVSGEAVAGTITPVGDPEPA